MNSKFLIRRTSHTVIAYKGQVEELDVNQTGLLIRRGSAPHARIQGVQAVSMAAGYSFSLSPFSAPRISLTPESFSEKRSSRRVSRLTASQIMAPPQSVPLIVA